MALSPKLVNRFYEPLIVLEALNDVHTDRIAPDSDHRHNDDARGNRRAVLEHLCIVCEYDKGGDAVTAMALEVRPAGLVYWVASNEDENKCIRPFLESILHLLASAGDEAGRDELTETLFRKFVVFGRPWLKKNWSFLQREIANELDRGGAREIDEDYEQWLRSFMRTIDTDDGLLQFCRDAYEARRSPFFPSRVTRRSPSQAETVEARQSWLRHRLGRMGTRLRAAKLLAQAAYDQPHLFQDSEVEPCGRQNPVRSPRKGKRWRTSDFASRMLPSGSEQLEGLTQALVHLEGIPEFRERVLKKCHDLKPRVHAEIAVLEAVYSAEIDFFDDDRFVACSKAACFCCYLYFSHHPGQFVRPGSHSKYYSNWSPPEPAVGTDKKVQLRVRDVMNAVIREVREAAMTSIRRCSRIGPWRPDSTSGITSTLRSLALLEDDNLSEAAIIDSPTESIHSVGDSSDAESVGGGVSLGEEWT